MKKETQNSANNGQNNPLDPKDQKIVELENKIVEIESKLLMALADYQNMLKEVEKQRAFMANIIKKDVFSDLIELFTDLYLGIDQLPLELKNEAHITGIVAIISKYRDLLAKHGVTEITFIEGDNYDPSKAEVVGFLEPSESEKSGKIAQTVQPGYCIKEVIIRPARVLIYKNS